MIQLTENALFHGCYLLRKQLGRGGFSEVWLVENTKVGNKKMALKVYAPGMGLDDDGVQLFSKEFELVYDLNHSHLLRPSHFDVCDRSPYLVLPFCERGSAKKFVGNITEEQAWHFLHDVASGLAYLHEQEPPIIHQDIKPDNVLIDKTGKFLITDFGISAKARSTLSSAQEAKLLTIAYTSPERFDKDNLPIKASDVWALGATMFELLEGDVPFGDHGGLLQKSGAEIPNMSKNYSPELTKIITKCLQKEPWDRPTAQQIVDWTEKRLRGEKINLAARKDRASSVSPSPTSRQTQPHTTTPHSENTPQPKTKTKRHPLIIVWIAAATVLAITLLVIVMMISKSSSHDDDAAEAIVEECTPPDMEDESTPLPHNTTPLTPISDIDPPSDHQDETSQQEEQREKERLAEEQRVREEQRRQAQLEEQRRQAQQEEEQQRQLQEEQKQQRLAQYNFVNVDKYRLGSNYMVVQRKSDSKWGIIDLNGNTSVAFNYSEAAVGGSLKNGYQALKNERGWTVFDAWLSKIASEIDNLQNYIK